MTDPRSTDLHNVHTPDPIVRKRPSVGRIVHYLAHGSPNGQHKSEPRAAVVTRVHTDECVDLTVLTPDGFFFNKSCTFGAGPGQWSWPPHVQ